MATIARVLARAFPNAAFSTSSFDIETLKQLALFCGTGLLVTLLSLTYGLDLSTGFF